jgi:hypothetical protein
LFAGEEGRLGTGPLTSAGQMQEGSTASLGLGTLRAGSRAPGVRKALLPQAGGAAKAEIGALGTCVLNRTPKAR